MLRPTRQSRIAQPASRVLVAVLAAIVTALVAAPCYSAYCSEYGIPLSASLSSNSVAVNTNVTVTVSYGADYDLTSGWPSCTRTYDTLKIDIYLDDSETSSFTDNNEGSQTTPHTPATTPTFSFSTTGTHKIKVVADDYYHSPYPHTIDDAAQTKELTVAVEPDPTTLEFDHGLPASNLNANATRSNIRWADADTTKLYGDYFVLDSGTWTVDTIRVWVVPEVPVAPTYALGSYYSDVTLYYGTSGSLGSESGTFTTDSNLTSNADITVVPVTYSGSVNYQNGDGTYGQIWRIDFNNLGWTSVSGGTNYIFGVLGTPRKDRLWFNHASNSTLSGWSVAGNGYVLSIDSTSLTTAPSSVDGSPWFGRGSDINVQVFAHSQ